MKKILIIDDDPRGIAPLAIRLKSAGYRVITAINGTEGLKLAIEHAPDLIVMDIWMPEGIGVLSAQRLKNIGLAKVPVIFLTASKREDLWAFVEEVEPAGFFEKPYDSKQLLEFISQRLGDTKSNRPASSPLRSLRLNAQEKRSHAVPYQPPVSLIQNRWSK